jgi:hypothetical protein
MFDFNSFSPEILTACLAHARDLRQRMHGRTFERGFIVDIPFSYATGVPWEQWRAESVLAHVRGHKTL